MVQSIYKFLNFVRSCYLSSLFGVEKKKKKRDMIILYFFLCIIFNPPCNITFSILSISQTIIFRRLLGTVDRLCAEIVGLLMFLLVFCWWWWWWWWWWCYPTGYLYIRTVVACIICCFFCLYKPSIPPREADNKHHGFLFFIVCVFVCVFLCVCCCFFRKKTAVIQNVMA